MQKYRKISHLKDMQAGEAFQVVQAQKSKRDPMNRIRN